MTRRVVPCIALAALATGPVRAQGVPRPEPAPLDTTPLLARPRWNSARYLSSGAPLEFALSRPLEQGQRFALVVGTADVSASVDLRGGVARYRPDALRLPAGENEAVAYIVTADGAWFEVGRAPIRVRNRAGVERATGTPSIDFASAGQLDQLVPDGAPPPDRNTYQDLTLRLGINSNVARDGWELSVQSNAVGVTERRQRLRWNDEQSHAPALDLADYRVQVTRGPMRVSLGNISAGANRYLLSGFASRGASATVRLHRAASLDAAAVNGTNVVGWTNMLGMGDADHRLATTALNLEFVPSRPGALHLDITGLDGSLLPRTGFTQGSATDAEESRGYGVQFTMSDARQRVRVAGGFTRSRFANPADPLLTGDTILVAVRPTTRSARYGEFALQLLQDRRILDSTRISLATTLRHERIDPLFRSVGAHLQSDTRQDAAEVTGTVGALAFQGSLGTGRDNLARIPSILTTRTRRRGVSLSAPLAGLLGVTMQPWLPAATFAWERSGQVGEGVPVNGDFSASHVPEQWNTVRTASLTWSPSRWSLALRWNESFQDNRQVGREQADFRARVHAISLGLTGWPRLTPSLDASVERQDNLESRTQQRTTRLGSTLQALLTPGLSFSGTASRTWAFEPLADRRTRNVELQGELSQGFTLYGRTDGGTQGRLFVRYARTHAAFFPSLPDPAMVPQLLWTINAGSSIRLF